MINCSFHPHEVTASFKTLVIFLYTRGIVKISSQSLIFSIIPTKFQVIRSIHSFRKNLLITDGLESTTGSHFDILSLPFPLALLTPEQNRKKNGGKYIRERQRQCRNSSLIFINPPPTTPFFHPSNLRCGALASRFNLRACIISMTLRRARERERERERQRREKIVLANGEP